MEQDRTRELEADRRLIDAVMRGDPDAVASWYAREHPRVFRLALGFLACPEDAEDMAQDAMLHLMDHLHRWNGKTPFRGFRNAVVTNLCRDRLRRKAVRKRAEDEAATALEKRSPLPDPAAAVDQQELRCLFASALRKVPPREREVFVLRDLEEVSTSEVAETLGIRPASVRSLLSLARSRLRKILASRLPESPRP